MTPKPPAFEMAATRWCSLTQLMAPPMMATRQPRNAAPRAHSASSRARAATRRALGGAVSGGIEAVGGVQRAHGKLGVFGADQHRDLDLARGNHLDVDAARGERLEHGAGDAGVAAH